MLNDGTVHNLEEKVDKLADKIDMLDETLTDLRVMINGRSPRPTKPDTH